MNLVTVRKWQVEQLEKGVKTVESVIRASDPTALTTYRDGGTGWTALEVLCHLRDFEAVYQERVRRTVQEDNPALTLPNPDELAAAGRYNEQDIETALSTWKTRRAEQVAYLRERAETDWERPAAHPTRGNLPLHEQLFLQTWHDMNHLEQMTRILAEKKTS
jgi:hypothetical protein